MDDWEEIKRLAADFQRTQTSDTLQKISERNCIDIVKKLTDLRLIELIYTCDGKEFVTPSHLIREIEDEVYVSGGRVHLHELASTLNVDYQHIENKSKELVADKPDEYNLVLGQLIHSTYKDTLSKIILDTMIETGELRIADFSKNLDLPTDFLLTLVKELLPKTCEDFVIGPDERTFYSADLMNKYKSIIAGTMTAISIPTTIASILKRVDIPEKLFASIVDGLIKEGRLDATIENKLYIPSKYAREQNEWIDKFYSSNSYIEYDVLLRRDIKQPKSFLAKRFPEGMALKTCYVNPSLLSQVESLVEECVTSKTLLDIASILPPSIQAEDIEMMLQSLLDKNRQLKSSCIIKNQTVVCSLKYIASCKESFNVLMQSKSEEHLKQGRLIEYFLGGKASQKQPKPERTSAVGTENKQQAEEGINQKRQQLKARDENDQDQSKPETKPSFEKAKSDDFIEMTPEDIKREKRNKKGKMSESTELQQDSGNEQSSKKGKGKKSGGGTQGREIRQKAVKKKYLAGSRNNPKYNDDSDEDIPASKTPRSNKGRAAKRAASPTPQSSTKSQGSGKSETKEPLTFMTIDEMVAVIRGQTNDSSDYSENLFHSIAQMIGDDLNREYLSVAKQKLDTFLKTQYKQLSEDGDTDNEIEMVE